MFKDETIRKELTRLASQLRISGTEITFCGKPYPITPENTLQGLVNILYGECYALKETYQSGALQKQSMDTTPDKEFLDKLSASNNTQDRWEKGWQLRTNYLNGYTEMVRNEQVQVVPVSALQGGIPAAPQAGQEFTVFFQKEDTLRQPAFYYVFSNRHVDATQKLTRVYWNISSEGAPVLVDLITRKLNHYNIPFLFKCLSHPSLYCRRDAAVLYVADTTMPLLSQLLPEIYEVMKPYLEEDVPLFTYAFRKGIGIAENPGSQESFGMNRMTAVALAFLATPRTDDVEDTMQAIGTAFLARGLNPAKPYLNKGSQTLN